MAVLTDKLIAVAQVLLSVLYTTGFFIILIMFMLGFAKVPDKFDNAFTGLLNLLTAAQLAIIYFWFQRQRGGAPPGTEPPTTTTEEKPK